MDFSIKDIYTSLISSHSKGLKETVIKGAAGTIILRIVNKFLAFILTIILARYLGASGYGSYSYFLTIIALLSIPSVLGMDRLLIREVAKYRALGRWDLIKGLQRWTNSIVIIFSLIIAVITIVVGIMFFKDSQNIVMPAFFIGILLIPLNSLIRLKQAILQGLQQIITGQIPELLVQPLLFIVFLFFAFIIIKVPPTINVGILLNLISTTAAFIAIIYLLKKSLSNEIKKARSAFRKSEWIRSVIPFFWIGIILIINQRADIVILGAMKNTEAVGIYSIASKLADLITFILITVNTPLAPIIASLYASGEKERLQSLIRKIVRVLFLVSFPVVMLFILLGKWILLIFGKDFTDGATALAILSIAQFVNVSAGPVGLLLTMTGHEIYAMRGLAVSVIINIILNLKLIPVWGINGCAIASAFSIIIWNFILGWFVYKKAGIKIW